MSAKNNKYKTSSNKPTTYKRDDRFQKHEIAVTLSSKDKNKKMSIEEITAFGKRILNGKKAKSEFPDECKMMILGMTDQGIRTLSGYNSNIDDMETQLDDYLNSYVQDSGLERFKQLSSVQFTVIY